MRFVQLNSAVQTKHESHYGQPAVDGESVGLTCCLRSVVEWTLNRSRFRGQAVRKAHASSIPLGFSSTISQCDRHIWPISNSTAVVIGAMIVAPLMDPILSLAFGISVTCGRLIRRSAVLLLGVAGVVFTSGLIGLFLALPRSV